VVLLVCWEFEKGGEVEVATLVLPTIAHPLRVLANDISDIVFITALAGLSPLLASMPAIGRLGRHSLLVYLVHPLLYKLVLPVLLGICTLHLLGTPAGVAEYWIGAAASVAAVAAASLLIASVVTGWTPSRLMITPRNAAEWPPIALFGTLRRSGRVVRDSAVR
jgi:hypothetical protein